MSYNVNIPQITDPILQSQPQIRTNFQIINNAFADNHLGLTKNQDFSGMHNVLTLRPQTIDPATSATQIAIYNKLVSTIPEMFFRPNNSQTPIQLTYPSIKVDSTNTQYSFVAGPFVFYFGFIANPTNGQVVNLSPGTTLLDVDIIIDSYKGSPTAVAMAIPINIAGNSFTIKTQVFSGSTTFNIFYMAIGL